ncbi:c-type cytochrome biogenesis protein CcmI [Maritalea porphyrae]|uniref:c-type cytochrome biogenesis protein CcmI n=1 Tax=Maritalea porphyrae TaxID=880732 RepID=UPI0022AF5E3A|nr:c-type cytochrome biogenesis protein CcmI [Maritalea porphyrae]MCZ4271139.1 c-type cytochrome biogenesis protein CcmI [Maritalea porphyrae]
MIFWIAIGLIAAVCALVLAMPIRKFGTDIAGSDTERAEEIKTAREFYELQLAELHGDLEATKLDAAEFEAAKLELDKEFLRQSQISKMKSERRFGSPIVIGLSVPAVLAIALATYVAVGNPGMRNAPLAERVQNGENIDIVDAIAKIEKRLFDVPDDLQGWKVIAPIYMRQQAFEKAVTAFRNIVRLEGESADNLTDLAEASVLAQNGDATGEPLALLNQALALQPNHLRSQFYLAGEATRTGDFETAIELWTNVLRDNVGNEPWLETARAGLQVARDGLQGQVGTPGGPTQDEVDAAMQMSETDRSAMIENMVSGLQERLFLTGGSPSEWQRLLKARLVQGQIDIAQKVLGGAREDLKGESAQLVEFEELAATEIAQLEKLEK